MAPSFPTVKGGLVSSSPTNSFLNPYSNISNLHRSTCNPSHRVPVTYALPSSWFQMLCFWRSQVLNRILETNFQINLNSMSKHLPYRAQLHGWSPNILQENAFSSRELLWQEAVTNSYMQLDEIWLMRDQDIFQHKNIQHHSSGLQQLLVHSDALLHVLIQF